MQKVHVPLDTRAYNILIGEGIVDQIDDHIAPFLNRPKIAVVTDSTVAPLHLARLEATLTAAGIDVQVLVLPAGEGTKSWPYLTQTVEWFLDQKVERQDLVIAFGGGVIGDLVGFAAAILRRGIRFVQVPTTLLAQVDSSVGGKTGINTSHGKNLVGAFHQPVLVLADTGLLRSLPDRDFLAGYGEVVKYGLLGDAAFFEWLEENARDLRSADPAAVNYAVKRSCEMKADIVVRDETEQGDRALLNLGHTFCHALEAATGYSQALLHGEGVAIGCNLAFTVSQKMGWCPQEDPSRIRAHFQAMGLKADLRDIGHELPNAQALAALMQQDKKVVDGQLRFIMARGIGQSFVTRDVDMGVVESVLDQALIEHTAAQN